MAAGTGMGGGGGGNAATSAAANSAKVERVVEDPKIRKWIPLLHFNYPKHCQPDLVSIMASRADTRMFQKSPKLLILLFINQFRGY